MADKKPKAEDYIPKDLANEIAKAITAGISKGAKEGFSSKNFLQDLNSQMKDYMKDQQAAQVNEKVKNLVMKTGVDVREAELDVLSDMALKQNESLVAEQKLILAGKQRLMNMALMAGSMTMYKKYWEETRALEGDIAGLQQENNLIKQGTEERKKQLKATIENEKAEERAAKVRDKIKEATAWQKKYKDAVEDVVDVLKTPQLAKAVFFEQMLEKGEKVFETFEKLDKSGLSLGQRVDYMRKSFSLMSAMGLSDTEGVLDGMVESYGTLNAMTDTQIDHVGHLAKQMGVSGQEAFGMVDAFSKMPGETMETAANTADFVNNLAKANGIAPGKITKDIAKNTEATALFSGKGAKGFAQAAVELHKMGVEIGTASKMAQGLLNFEDSINKQMEASVLLGREINLDKARELSLNGDLEGATREVMNNIGGAAEFEKMNVLQKQALAQATGMTVEELSKAVDAQEEMNKYHGEDASLLNKSLGFIMEMGGGVAKLGKEYGMAALSLLQMVFQWRTMKALQGDTAKSSGGFFSKMFGGGKSPKIETPAVPKTDAVADAGKKMGGGGMMAGFQKNMKALADGFKEMAGSKVSQGIWNVAKAGPAMVLGIGALPFMGIVALLGTPAGAGLQGLSEGLKGKGMGAALVATGVLNLTEFALAGVIGIAAIPFMFMLMLGKAIGAGLKGLAEGLKALGSPAVAAGAGILSMVLLSAGASMLMFGAGVGLAAAGMSLLVASLKDVPFENLLALPVAFMGIAVGLGLMAYAGMAALPVLAALTAFALVAPALTGLGSAIGGMFGGGGEGEKEDTSKLLLEEIKGLRADLNKGGVINMDGKKVGEVIRLGLNSAGIR